MPLPAESFHGSLNQDCFLKIYLLSIVFTINREISLCGRWRDNYRKTIKPGVWSPDPAEASVTWLPHLRLRDQGQGEGHRGLEEPEERGVCCNTVSPWSVRSYTHEVSLTWLSKHKLDNGQTNRHAKVDRGKLMRPQPRHLRNAESRRNRLTQGRATNWLSDTKWLALKT